MPGIASAASAVATTAQRNNDHHLCNGTPSRNARLSSSNGFWSKHQQELTYNQLQKFWSEISPQSRQKLLRIDKQTLFEQARKHMYCSRCHGLLVEGFLQIVMYGKALQQQGMCNHNPCNRLGGLKSQDDCNLGTGEGCPDDIQDPSVHPWGGLTTTQNGMLTLLDCYLYTTSLKGLQNVFDRARARERERELLYPDACGGDGRGWVSQEMAGYGRVHTARESCALHTARLPIETLVDFWSALGEETRRSLLRMKEEDFIERLMYRFDSKRFCRDCRRNVIREFKELKELKRIRRENRCTAWFCVADAAFQYQVSHDTILADWHQTFGDTFGAYHHFEWAVGTGEGKYDILEFENVGLNGRVQVKGLNLSAMNSCFITLRGWKMDGRCTELSVKAHALKGQQCVHRRLVVGDGFVSITRGESIIRFFEHAEEAEEEEDDDSMDKDGNEIDGGYSRPQKHAKSPELAREFLLDAATVIFKEQVEKAFREGTARQNAHSIFVCLSLKLLEERLHVACKEIITLEKQMKLLEEEEKEKREEEERKERKRSKERGKKLRRKERLREKEKDRGIKSSESNQDGASSDVTEQVLSAKVDNDSSAIDKVDSVSEAEEAVAFRSLSSDVQDEQLLDEFFLSDTQVNSDCYDDELSYANDCSSPLPVDHLKYSHQKLKFRQELDACSRWSDRRSFAVVSKNRNMVCKYEPKKQVTHFDSSRSSNGLNKQPKSNRPHIRNGGPKSGEKFSGDWYESHSCSCRQYKDNGTHVELQTSRVARESKPISKLALVANASRPYYRHNQAEYTWDKCGRSKNSSNQDSLFVKKVWEPLESKKKHPHSNSDHGENLKSSHLKVETTESDLLSESCVLSSCQVAIDTSVQKCQENKQLSDTSSTDVETKLNMENGFLLREKTPQHMENKDHDGDSCTVARASKGTLELSTGSSSNSENCSSCLSEGDSTTFSSNAQSTESSSSDSEDASQNSEGRELSACHQNGFPVYQDGSLKKDSTGVGEHAKGYFSTNGACTNSWGNLPSKGDANIENEVVHVSIGPQPQALPPVHNQSMGFPIFQAPPMGYYHHGPVPWPVSPAASGSNFMAFPHPNQYLFASPTGYGLNGNTHFTPYAPLHHLPSPMLNHSHVPGFQPVVHNNGVSPKEYASVPSLGVLKAAHPEANVSWMPSAGKQPPEAHPKAENGKTGKCDKSDVGKDGFSLFHFGGPLALSTGFMSDFFSLKKEIGDDTPTKLITDDAGGDEACKKNTKIEEYNLFAASSGIKFSIF